MVRLAFHRSGSTLLGRIGRLFERGAEYIHTELVFSDGCAYSCVGNEGLENFGVRKTYRWKRGFNSDWKIIDLPFISPDSEARIRACGDAMIAKRTRYDVLCLIGMAVGRDRVEPDALICSESNHLMLASDGYWREQAKVLLSPHELYIMVTTEPWI